MMNDNSMKNIRILMADDDEDDRLLMQEALEEVNLGNEIDYVEDGEELLDYLRRENKYESYKNKPYPDLILLDLNMPKKSGSDALAEIKKDVSLRKIPIVILTTSKAEEDIIRTYDLGVNSFLAKPVDFDDLVSLMKATTDYWLNMVKLPPNR